MYTELIFGAKLKKDTPNEIIESLKYMIGELEEKPKDFLLPSGRYGQLFRSSSYYFAVNRSVKKIWLDDIDNCWHISTRSNIKNYGSEIEIFLEWIKPFIESGSGDNEMYAIVMYEGAEEPIIYYLNNKNLIVNKKLKSLEESNEENSKKQLVMNDQSPQLNGISCPKCGGEFYDSNPMVTLTSMPLQKNIHCSECGYAGYRIA